MNKTLLLPFVLSAFLSLPVYANDDVAEPVEAELSDDQSQGEPEVVLTPEQQAAAAAATLPMIQLGPKNNGKIDQGALCHSKFAQRSPICAASN